jgi:aryl-alcohol dehydrogenase-like predicted oxidoreductase
MELRTRVLGRSGIRVSALGMGCWAIGGPATRGQDAVGWGTVDDAESIRAIHRALDLGVTFFDTADTYGAGHSEIVLGKALAGKRKDAIIATKFGNTFIEGTGEMSGPNAEPEYIRRACNASLRRLGADVIDLYQFHLGGYETEKAPEVLDTLERLAESGKIRTYGWSTDDPERARLFARGRRCTAVQNQLNVLSDAPAVLAVCEDLDLASIDRGPLAMGLLTGKYTADSHLPDNDVRGANSPAWMSYFSKGAANSELLARLGAIREILGSDGRTLAQGALAWIWARSPRTVPIPGFKSVTQVQENSGAMAHGPLDVAQMREIDRLLGR